MLSPKLEKIKRFIEAFAKQQRHEFILTEHLLFGLLHDSEVKQVLHELDLTQAEILGLKEQLRAYFDSYINPATHEIEKPIYSQASERVIRRAIVQLQSSGQERLVESTDFLAALMSERDSYAVSLLLMLGVDRTGMLRQLSHRKRQTAENTAEENSEKDPKTQKTPKPKNPLEAYAQNLNEKAQNGKIDPLIGRQAEILRVAQILCRRRKNNPLLVGDPGVGKTAIAEGLAWLIVQGRVADALKNATVYSLNAGALVAGTKFRGDFEARMKALLDALRGRPDAILFIDEIHTIIGAGGASEGNMDMSNLIKPALANGELRCIGSTTFSEYRQVFEKDSALSRRFQKIDVKEPSVDETVRILEGLKAQYESHHGVVYDKEALLAAVNLSVKHLHERFLPDKAIDVIDEAGARARLGAMDGISTEVATQITAEMPTEIATETATNAATKETTKNITEVSADAQASENISTQAALQDTPKSELEPVDETFNKDTPNHVNDVSEDTKNQDVLSQADTDNQANDQAETPKDSAKELTSPIVIDVAAIEAVVSSMARIPPASVSKDELAALKTLGADLSRMVFGQEDAITRLVDAITLSKAGLKAQEKPIGSFLFAGPTGVGKTEIARQLSFSLGVELIRFDMSEYMEAHAVSRLIGSPPGYVGHDKGGLLTEKVHQTPHCILLLDELEKAHPDIFNILLQVMDHGKLTDNNGREVSFRQVVLIMTTNVGADSMSRTSMGFTHQDHSSDNSEALKRAFSPEFRNRLDAVVQFSPLGKEAIALVVDKFLMQLQTLLDDKEVQLVVDEAARAYLAEKGYDPLMGARPMARLIDDEIKKPLAQAILFGELSCGGRAVVGMTEETLTLTYTPKSA